MKSERVRELESKLTLPPDASEPDVFAEDGTDLTLVRQMLAMTPTERIRYAQSLAQSIARIQEAVRAGS